jgi:glycosyltransferase involved in cell wall biosynthesis
MRIAQFIASMGQGGAEKLFRDLSNALAKRHEITVISYDNPFILDQLDPGIRRIVLPKRSRRNPLAYITLYRMLKRECFDIVHTHAAKASGIAFTVRRFLPIRQVATKHNPRKGPVFDKAPHVVAVSGKVAETIGQESTVIYNGILPSDRQPDRQVHSPFTILAIGRLEPLKGFDRLIEQVATIDSDLRLEIVGDGPERGTLQDLIRELGQSERIRLIGFQTDIDERMSRSDLVVISSRSEGFSLIVAEALFHANLLISTPVGIAPEILDENLLVEIDELGGKIRAVMANRQSYRNCFDSVREQYRDRFRIESVVREYEAYYESVLAE